MPALVHVLPLDQEVSFTLIALVSMAAAAGFLHALMTTLEIPARLSAGLCLLFAISPGVLVVLLRNARNVDATTLLVMCAAAYFIVRRRALALCVTVALGAFVRESAMFLIPFAYAVWAERWIDLRVAGRVLLVALPAVAIYATLRLAVPTVGRELVVGYGRASWPDARPSSRPVWTGGERRCAGFS